MALRQSLIVAAAAVTALTLTACSSGSDDATPVVETLSTTGAFGETLGTDEGISISATSPYLDEDILDQYACTDIVIANDSDRALSIMSHDASMAEPGSVEMALRMSLTTVTPQDVEPGETFEGTYCYSPTDPYDTEVIKDGDYTLIYGVWGGGDLMWTGPAED